MPEFKTLQVGTERDFMAVFDMPDVPQGLREGEEHILAKDVQFYGKTFPEGTKVTFVGYIVTEMPSCTSEYDKYLLRSAAFRFEGEDFCRQLGADSIL